MEGGQWGRKEEASVILSTIRIIFLKLNVLKLHIVVRTNPGIQDNGFQHFAVEKS